MKLFKLFTYLLIALLFQTCYSTEPDNGDPSKPPGYQEDIAWPSLADSPWPMYQSDPQNTGRSRYVGPQQGIIKWKYEMLYGEVPSAIILDENGNVIIASGRISLHPDSTRSARVICFDPDGVLLWERNICIPHKNPSEIYCTPLIDSDGILYAGSTCGELFAINQDGSVKWKFDARDLIITGHGGINIDLAGNLYFSTLNNFYVVDKNAQLVWQSSKYSRQKAIISHTGNMIFMKSFNSVDALDIHGNLIWSYEILPGEYLQHIICDSQGNLYFENRTDTSFYAINSDGELRWNYPLNITTGDLKDDFYYNVSPALDKNGNIIFLTRNYLCSIDYVGNLRWKIDEKYVGGSPIMVDNEGSIFVTTTFNGYVKSISSQGTIKWTLQLEPTFSESMVLINCRPAIGLDGTLYIIAQWGEYSCLYAIK